MSDILESEIVDLVSSDDEEAESSQNVSEPYVRTHNYACIPCINKSFINPGETMDLNCLSCTLTSSDTERNAQYWCYNCNNLASCDCRAANHNIEIYNDYYHAQSLLIKSNMDQTNLICDEELQHSQKLQSGLHAIIAWIKVLQSEMTQRDSVSVSASYLCQVFIAQLESLKTAGVFNVAEKEGNGILNYIDHLTTHFSDRLTKIQAAQTKVCSLLDKCSFLQESTQPSSQFSNDEPSSDLVNAITTAFNCNDQSCVDVLVSLLKRGPNLGSAPELDSNQSKITDILKRKESIEVKIHDVCYNREPPCLKTSCLGKQRYPKRRAEEETESDTIKISKKSRGPPTVGFLHRETYDDQQVCSSPFIFGQEIQSYPVPTPSIETSSKGIEEMIDSENENFTNYCATFKQIRSELAQNFQDAQIKLKTLEERTIMFANEAVNLPEKMAKRVTELEADLASMTEKAKLADESSTKARQEASSLLKHAQEIQEKYENELIQHTIDVGQLNAVREEMDKLEQSHSQQESKLQQHATQFISEQTSWQAQKEIYGKENLEKVQKCAKRKKMIESLEKQITHLNSRIASATRCQEVLSRALIGEDTNSSLDSPVGEDDEMTKMILDQPLKMVHCLRREKDVAVTRCEVLETELQSLKTQLKETERQCIEFQATLSQEREERKVLIDSDRLLKDERDGLAGRVEEMTLEVSSLLSELGSLQNINQQSLCDMKKLSDENKMLRDQISALKTQTDVLQEKLEETLTEIKQTNIQLIAVKLELEKEAALAKEVSQKSQSDLVEALAKLEEKSSIALNYKTQFENLQIEHEKLVKEHEETCAVQSTRIQELEASIVKINLKLKELKEKNSVREKIRRKIQSFQKERNFSINSNVMPQLVPIKVTSSPTSANVSDDSPNENKQLQLFSSVKGKNTYPVVESRLDVIPLGSAKFSDMEEATVNEQSFNLLCREFEVTVHAQNCHREGKEPNEECTVCFCHPLKIVLKHSTSCHAGELCPVPNCWVSLAYQSEEVSNEITRLESDLQLVMEHAELAEDSEAVAHQEASNQAKLAIEARDKYENKLLRRTAKIEQLNIALEQSQSRLAAALEELASRPTLDDLRSQQSQKESVQKQLEQVQKEMEDIKQANFSEMEKLKGRISQAEEEMKNLFSQEEKLQTHQEQMKQSRDKLSVQLTESQQINTKVVAEKQELERKLRTSKEEIKELRSQKESTKMELERLKQSYTTLTEQLANSHQNNTQLFAEKQELEEQHRVAKEEIRNLESHKALILTELEEILHSPLTEYQENSNQLIEKKLDLEDRVAKEESWKSFSDKKALREKLKKTAHEVTQLRQKAVKYDELKICYDTRKLEHEKVLQERENLLRRVVQLRSGLEEAKKDYQVEERLRKKPRLETIQENQQDQKSASAKSTATTSVFNKVPQWMPQANPVSPTVNKVAPSASVVPSAGGSRGSHDSGKQPICVEAEDNHKSRKLFITRHDILNHARKCQLRQRNSNAKCHVRLCLESSLILNHIAKCKAGASCPTPHCLSSRKIIPYWKACNQLDCLLCYFRPVVNQNNSTSGVAITEVIEAVVEASRSSFQQVTDQSQPTDPFQFCSMARFEFLAMAMLTQLHNNGVNRFAYPCSYCKLQVETRLRCNVCSSSDFDFEMCTPCYNENGHNHEMVEIGFSLSVDSSNYNQTDLPERCPITLKIQSLVHSLECLNPNCYFLCCHRMKTIVKHMRSCEASICRICYQLVALIIYHAKHDCSKTKSSKECAVPFCNFLKRRISSSANMSIQSAFEKLACVTRAKDSRSEDLFGNSWPHQPNQTRKKTSTEKVNPQLILPSELCKYSEFGIY